MDYIDGFPYIEQSLHPWDEDYLVVVDNHFDVFLDSFGQDFIKYFCINVHTETGLKFSFFVCLFVCLFVFCGIDIALILTS